jgi:hypothetical protein
MYIFLKYVEKCLEMRYFSFSNENLFKAIYGVAWRGCCYRPLTEKYKKNNLEEQGTVDHR